MESESKPVSAVAPNATAAAMVDYDDGWETRWDDMRRYGPTGRHLRRIVLNMTDGLKYDSVLDVGCGQGALLEAMAARRPDVRYAGSEFSPAGLAMARRRVPGAEFVDLDLTRGPLDRRFDLVLCTDVVEHIDDDDAAFANLAAMTGRYLLVSTLQGRMRHFERRVGHYRNYRHGEVQAKLTAAGLRVIRVVEWGFPFYSPLYRDVLNAVDGQGTEGHYGPVRRLIAWTLYQIFRLNMWSRGDCIYVLAQRD